MPLLVLTVGPGRKDRQALWTLCMMQALPARW